MGKKENKAIVLEGIKAGKSDDSILDELYHKAGVKVNDLRPVFNDILKSAGLRLSAKERKAKTAEVMAGTKSIKTMDDLAKIVAKLTKALKVADSKAMGSLRTWAKGTGVVIPKAPKVMKPRKAGFGGYYKDILGYILKNRDADKAAVVKFCKSHKIPPAYSTQALNCVHFAKVWNGEIKDAE